MPVCVLVLTCGCRFLYHGMQVLVLGKLQPGWGAFCLQFCRCPIICRMSCKPGRWRCKISLLRETEHEGDPSPSKRKIEFGPVIYEKKDVCNRILRAQAAILHPKLTAEIFWKAQDLGNLKSSLSGTPTNEFSFDSIQVEIEGSSVQDLSFVDLPGKAQRSFRHY